MYYRQIFLSPKMAAILNFQIFAKMHKHKFASISLTVRDRAISSKLWTHRVSEQTTLQFSKKKSSPPKMAAILKFLIFAFYYKFASISLKVRDREISSKFSIKRVSQQSTLASFVQVLEQNSCFPLGWHYACQCVLFLVFPLEFQSKFNL